MSKKTAGIVLLILSLLTWAAVPLVPLVDLGTSQKWILGIVLYTLSWSLFAISVAVMGKEAYVQMKDRMIRIIRRKKADTAP